MTDSHSVLTGYEPEHLRLTRTHHFHSAGLASEAGLVGLEADYWPALTAVDYLVTMGQMAQALIELRRGAGRSGTLWMRSVSIRLADTPQPLPAAIDSSMSAIRDKLIERGDHHYRDIAVEATTSNRVHVNARLALEEAR